MSTIRNGEIYVSKRVRRALGIMHKAGIMADPLDNCTDSIAERLLIEGIQRVCPAALGFVDDCERIVEGFKEKEDALAAQLKTTTTEP